MIIMHRHWFIVRAHSITGNGDTGIIGMRSGAARGRWRWIVDPIYAASKTGLGNSLYKLRFRVWHLHITNVGRIEMACHFEWYDGTFYKLCF